MLAADELANSSTLRNGKINGNRTVHVRSGAL